MVASATVLHSAVCCNKRTCLPNDSSAYVTEPHRHSLCNWKKLIPISNRLKTKREKELRGLIKGWYEEEEETRERQGVEMEQIVGDGVNFQNQGNEDLASQLPVIYLLDSQHSSR